MARAVGSLGDIRPGGSTSPTNVAYQSTLTWANPAVRTLEVQAPLPMFGEEPIVEFGLAGREDEFLERLRADARHQEMFPAAFPNGGDPFTFGNVVKAIASFQRTLVSGDSPYDRYVAGDGDAMSESAVHGMELFFSEKLECFHCHGGFNFSASADHAGQVFDEMAFFNNGLHVGDGRENPNESLFVSGFELTDQEREDVLAFLRALTDRSFVEDPRFSDPFAE